MARKKQSSPAFEALDHAISQALNHGNINPLVIPSARMPGTQAVKIVRPTQIKSIKDTLIQIQHDADPIGFLINVMNGAMVECVYVDGEQSDIDPTVTVPALKAYYEQATLKQRIEIARALARMVLPVMSVQRHVVESPGENDGPDHGRLGEPGQPSFQQIVAKAAQRAQQIGVKIVEPSPEELADPLTNWGGSIGEGELPE